MERPDSVTGPTGHQQRVGWGLPDLPSDWTVGDIRKVGPFVTRAHVRRSDGRIVEWTPRRHRKHLAVDTDGGSRGDPAHSRPQASCWWMAALFAGGSTCFALGSVPLYFNVVKPSVVAITFFGGSVLFTCASAIQYGESRAAPTSLGSDQVRLPVLSRLFGVSLDHLDWWATAIQLLGTLMFNLSTFAATRSDLNSQQARPLIWAPDVLGSGCFLAASWLSYLEVNLGVRPRPDGSTGWHIAALNMVGSIAFGVAAIAARYLRTTGEPANIMIVNLATFVGAICFLGGAILLPVESLREVSENEATF